MNTYLYIGAELDIDPIINCHEYDRFIYTIDRPFNDLNDHILDDFIKLIKKQGYKVEIRQISFIHPFYIKCYNGKKYIKYYFNSLIPTSNMLRYDNITKIKVNPIHNCDHVIDQLNYNKNL